MKVLVAGLGYVGGAFASLMHAEGHEVWGLSRSPQGAKHGNIRTVEADASTGQGFHQIPHEFDLIASVISPDRRDDDSYRAAYPDVAASLVAHYPGTRLLLVSSSAVYDQNDGVEVTEKSPATAPEFSAARIRDAENIVLAAHSDSAVLRASGIYGPGRLGLATRLLFEPPKEDARSPFTNRIHREDLARALAFVASDSAQRGIFLATDQRPCTIGELSDFLHAIEPRPFLSPPEGTRKSTRPQRSRRLRAARLLEAGFHFKYPSFQEGYRTLLSELRERQAV